MASLINIPAAVKITMYMRQGPYSWSEAHYLTNGVTDFTAARIYARTLCGYRAACLGNYASLFACTLSATPSNRQVEHLNPDTWLRTGNWPADPAGGTYSSDAAYSSLLLRMAASGRSKNLYLAGIPDSVIETGPTLPNGYTLAPVFYSALTTYLNYLAPSGGGAFGYRSRDKSADVSCVGVSTNALYPNAIGLTTLTPLPGVGLGSEVYASGWRRVSTKTPGLSGAYSVVGYLPVTPTNPFATYFLGETGNVSPTNLIPYGDLGPLNYDLPTYTTWFVTRAVCKKRGGSYGLPHGKLRARR